MTHTYQITGMTCAGCVKTVEQVLSKIDGVTAVKVNLEAQNAQITMHHHIATAQLQKALAGTNYTLSESDTAMPVADTMAEDEPITWKTYLPVLLLFGYIAGSTLLIQLVSPPFDLAAWMRHFMAGFFLAFSFFKLLDIPAFAVSYSSYDIIAKRWLGYGYIYPFIELALGILFLIPAAELIANAATLLVMSVSIVGVIQSMLRKSRFQCACLGAVFKLPIGKITLFEDALMIAMSAGSLLMLLVK
ncbi:MAG TPA: MauE/DoxX family redox-associated membrane protein [Chitinophagales bacterium]|nr:MauE/DoxX family redox-associated membrane protein [Chitinophagales bacterium]